MILQAIHTHLYPGHSGEVSGLAQIDDLQACDECLVEFADGTATAARLSSLEKGWLLETAAYRTAAGTGIEAKRWLVDLEQAGSQVKFRVLKKAAAA